jgi:hypothetical protein
VGTTAIEDLPSPSIAASFSLLLRVDQPKALVASKDNRVLSLRTFLVNKTATRLDVQARRLTKHKTSREIKGIVHVTSFRGTGIDTLIFGRNY